VDDRPKTNAVILLDKGHNKGRPTMGGMRQGKEIKNLNVADVLTVLEKNIVVLNWPRPIWEGE
jgi:hypothetical protein